MNRVRVYLNFAMPMSILFLFSSMLAFVLTLSRCYVRENVTSILLHLSVYIFYIYTYIRIQDVYTNE